MNPKHLSASQLGTLAKCGEQYRRRYIEGEILPPGFAAMRGKMTHSTIEANLLHKMKTGEPLELEAIEDLAADAVTGSLQGEFVLDGEYADLGLAESKGRIKDEVIGLSRLHAEEVAPTIRPTGVEMRVELPPSEALPVPFLGIIDCVDGGTRIRDAKTKTKAPPSNDAETSLQLSAYALLFRSLYGSYPDELQLDYLIRTPKKGDLRKDKQVTTRDQEDVTILVRRAQSALRVIESEIFLPAPPDSWACSERWCGYWNTCPFARGKSRPTS